MPILKKYAVVGASCSLEMNKRGHKINKRGHKINKRGHKINKRGHKINKRGQDARTTDLNLWDAPNILQPTEPTVKNL